MDQEIQIWKIRPIGSIQEARGILKKILSSYLQLPSTDVVLLKKKGGKPFIEGKPVRFSFSHTNGLALVVIARNREVGADVEKIRDTLDADKIARRFFAPAEAREIAALQGDEKILAFFDLWTRKEAYAKAKGLGLAKSIHEPVGADPSIVIQKLEIGEGYSAAVAAGGDGWTVSLKDFED